MTTKIRVSKKFNGAPISVTLESDGIGIEVLLADFISSLAAEAATDLAADAVRNAGSPALLLTNAQLMSKVASTISPADVLATLAKHGDALVSEMKKLSVVAE